MPRTLRSTMNRFSEFCGANPLQLLALIGCFALAGYVYLQISAEPALPRMLLWFAGAVVAHDLVLFPVYALADRSLTGATDMLRAHRRTPPAVPAINYIRLPALGSGLLLLLFFPGIIEQGSATYLAATGQTQQPFLGRWLLITAALFAISAVLYAIRLGTTQYRYRDQPSRSTQN